MLTRRRLLALLPLTFVNLAAWRATVHPTPRKGITAARVLKADQLKGVDPEIIKVFDMVREIPHVVDGIYCHCGCAELDGSYSLLTCFEGGGMAQACQICQGEGRMVYEMQRKGRKLDDIRAAIDRNFA